MYKELKKTVKPFYKIITYRNIKTMGISKVKGYLDLEKGKRNTIRFLRNQERAEQQNKPP